MIKKIYIYTRISYACIIFRAICFSEQEVLKNKIDGPVTFLLYDF